MSTASRTNAAKAELWTDPLHYAIVDLAAAKELRPMIGGLSSSSALTLFAEKSPKKLLLHAPWLVRLSKSPEVEDALQRLGADVPWGYYVHSSFDIVSLRQSLRKFNVVQLESTKKEVMFRYWDPRVMRAFLNVATRKQRQKFFELIDWIDVGADSFDASGKPRRNLG